MKLMERGAGILLTLAMAAGMAFPACAAGPSGGDSPVKGILYRIHSGTSTAYLLGSIHIGNQEMYPFGEALQEAMAQADTFVFECDTGSGEALETVRSLMYAQDGTRLEDMVSPECYEKLRQVCERKGYPLAGFETLRPWAAMNLLSFEVAAGELGMENAQAAQALGVETHVKAFAQEKGKALAYLETTREQLEVLDGFSLDLQRYMLEQTLDVILEPSAAKGLDADMASWPALWREGDAQAFAERYWEGYAGEEQEALVQEYHAKLVTERNILMADRLAAMMEERPGTYFITVGLLHVVLPGDSVAQRMEEKGYQVEFLSGL